MGDLKPGWRRVKFGEVVRLNKETCKDPEAEGIERYIGLEHLEPGDLRVRSWGDVSEGTTFTNRVRPGQVLFGKRRAYQRKVAVADFHAVCSGDIYVLESAHPAQLLPELLPFICQTDAFFDHAVGTSAGSLSPRTNWSSLAKYEFALPPLDEQHRIARLLRASANHLDRLHYLVHMAQMTLASYRDAHFASLCDAQFVSLSTAIVDSAYGPRFSAANYTEAGNTRSIRTTDMPEFGVLTLDTAPAAKLADSLVQDHQLRNGDFLISRTGFTSGRAAVFTQPAGDSSMYIPAAFLVRLRLDQCRLRPAYLLEYIQSSPGWEMIRGLQRGTQQLNISASALASRKVPIPPITSQSEALEIFSSMKRANENARQRHSNASMLMRRLRGRSRTSRSHSRLCSAITRPSQRSADG